MSSLFEITGHRPTDFNSVLRVLQCHLSASSRMALGKVMGMGISSCESPPHQFIPFLQQGGLEADLPYVMWCIARHLFTDPAAQVPRDACIRYMSKYFPNWKPSPREHTLSQTFQHSLQSVEELLGLKLAKTVGQDPKKQDTSSDEEIARKLQKELDQEAANSQADVQVGADGIPFVEQMPRNQVRSYSDKDLLKMNTYNPVFSHDERKFQAFNAMMSDIQDYMTSFSRADLGREFGLHPNQIYSSSAEEFVNYLQQGVRYGKLGSDTPSTLLRLRNWCRQKIPASALTGMINNYMTTYYPTAD